MTYTKTEENYIDLINIEEELLDPKWYSDLNVDVNNASPQKTSKQYEELVEAVTPFVQFKENLKSNNNASNNLKSSLVKPITEMKFNTKDTVKLVKNVKFDLTVDKAKPTAKRKLSLPKTTPINCATTPVSTTGINTSANNILVNTTVSQVNRAYYNKKRKIEPTNGFIKPTIVSPITAITTPTVPSMLPSTTMPSSFLLSSASRKPTSIPTTIVKHEPTKEKQTAQILNKLQNLGLQVKRTQPLPPPIAANNAASNKTDTKTLEILQRLQSKGMKVKILNKQQIMDTNVNMPTAKQGIMANNVQKPMSLIHDAASNVTIRQNFNKNLIIKKVN